MESEKKPLTEYSDLIEEALKLDLSVKNEERKEPIVEPDYQELIIGYQASLEQNKLYAEFRWKVFSYISTLQAGLFVLVLNIENELPRIMCSIIGIIISLVLWMLERRHHQLFTQSRNSGKLFEEALGIEKLGVFNTQLRKKKGLGHAKLVVMITILTIIMWSASICVSLFY